MGCDVSRRCVSGRSGRRGSDERHGVDGFRGLRKRFRCSLIGWELSSARRHSKQVVAARSGAGIGGDQGNSTLLLIWAQVGPLERPSNIAFAIQLSRQFMITSDRVA